jgi:hypothetical protein
LYVIEVPKRKVANAKPVLRATYKENARLSKLPWRYRINAQAIWLWHFLARLDQKGQFIASIEDFVFYAKRRRAAGSMNTCKAVGYLFGQLQTWASRWVFHDVFTRTAWEHKKQLWAASKACRKLAETCQREMKPQTPHEEDALNLCLHEAFIRFRQRKRAEDAFLVEMLGQAERPIDRSEKLVSQTGTPKGHAASRRRRGRS